MPFVHWDPCREVAGASDPVTEAASGRGWTPPVDLYETPERYVIVVELAGIPRASVRVTVEDSRLTFEGERPAAAPPERYHRLERGYGAFARTFRLPSPIDASAVEARSRDGLLTIRIPKSRPAGPHRVDVGDPV
jgi:HSP20 family protein